KRHRVAASAQYLPSSIIQRIAGYVSAADDYYRDKSGRERNTNDTLSRASQPLVGVCRSWRVAVLAQFYRQYVLDINCTAMHISRFRKMVDTGSREINDNVRNLARSVHITVPFAGIFNGKVAHILDASGFGGAVFPAVQHLWLNFYAGTTVPVEEMQNVDECIAQFTAYVAAVFPNASRYHLQVSLFTDSDDSCMVGALLNALIGGARHPLRTVEYVHSSSGVRIGGLAGVVGLTHITIQDDANPADCINLVRRNAATLVAADLGIVDALDYLPRLTTDDDGCPITYPRLRSLAIHVNLIPDDTSVAFPALETLHRTSGKLHRILLGLHHMSLTGFLFGNVDEEGNLSDTELDNELRNTLGDGGGYLSNVLGSGIFSDSAEGKAKTSKSASDDDNDSDEADIEPGSRVGSAMSTHAYGSPAVRPAKDAIDFSDFNELADDAAVPKKWPGGLPAGSALNYASTAGRTQLDDDYDDESDGAGGQPGDAGYGAQMQGQPEYSEEEEEEEEAYDDLFESPEQAATRPAAAGAGGDQSIQSAALPPTAAHGPPALAADTAQLGSLLPGDAQPAVARGVKRIPPGPIRFSDYFGCQIVRRVKRPRRPPVSDADQEPADSQRLVPAQPALDTRKLLAGKHNLEPSENFLHAIISRSMAADDKSD
ncbi:hypothetical protein H4R23_005384, partial [Coemansia sp. Cherry 401B]